MSKKSWDAAWEPKLKHAFCDWIRSYRLAAGLSQTQLADRMGIARANLARMEAGVHWPNTMIVLRYLAHCGADPEHVTGTFTGYAKILRGLE